MNRSNCTLLEITANKTVIIPLSKSFCKCSGYIALCVTEIIETEHEWVWSVSMCRNDSDMAVLKCLVRNVFYC